MVYHICQVLVYIPSTLFYCYYLILLIKVYFYRFNICLMLWFIVRKDILYLSSKFIIDTNNIIMHIFWWDMSFSNNINITFTWCINQFPFLDTFPVPFPETFLIITVIRNLSLSSLGSSGSFHPVSEFLPLSYPFVWMLGVLVTVCKVKFTLKRLIMYIA